MTETRIRPATRDDWPQIWPFFGAIVAGGRDLRLPGGPDRRAAPRPWMEQPPGHTVVLEDDGVVLGTAKMGPTVPVAAHVGTASFMVDPEAAVAA